MSTPAAGAAAELSWRVPPYQPAALLLLVSGAAALNIYGHPSHAVRLVTLAFGALALAMAVLALRMFLLATDEGIAVRFLGRTAWLPWPEIDRIEVVSGVRGADTIRLSRRDGSYVDVPPSLLQPTLPTSKPRALARLHAVAAQLQARGGRG